MRKGWSIVGGGLQGFYEIVFISSAARLLFELLFTFRLKGVVTFFLLVIFYLRF